MWSNFKSYTFFTLSFPSVILNSIKSPQCDQILNLTFSLLSVTNLILPLYCHFLMLHWIPQNLLNVTKSQILRFHYIIIFWCYIEFYKVCPMRPNLKSYTFITPSFPSATLNSKKSHWCDQITNLTLPLHYHFLMLHWILQSLPNATKS